MNVTADISQTAYFSINQYVLTYTAGANGSISGSTSQTVDHGTDGSAVTAVPNTGYSFTSWSDGSTSASRTDANVTANVSVTANFTINRYTLTYAAGANGSISGSTSQTVDYNTSGSAVTPVADSGYHFTSWSDGSTANPRTDTNVTANVSVTASFVANTYTLTYTAGAGGSISGTTPQTVSQGGSGTAVTAVASSGYSFTGWSDGSTQNPRTDTNVTADITVAANFYGIPTVNINSVTKLEGTSGTPLVSSTLFTFTVSLSAPSAQTVTVNYTKADVTTDASDFNAPLLSTGTLTFLPGETTKQLLVYVRPDNGQEPDQAFTITLSQGNNNSVIGTGVGLGRINNDDGSPSIRVSAGLPADLTSLTISEGQSANGFIMLTLVMPVDVTISYSLIPNTAATPGASCADVSGGVCPSGTVVIPAGLREVAIPAIPFITGDGEAGQERFQIKIPTGGVSVPSGTAPAIERAILSLLVNNVS